VTRCPFCGAEAVPGHGRCWDCSLPPGAPHAEPLAEDSPEPEVAYELAEWPASSRVLLANDLAERNVAFRWEEGPTLLVREADEAVVEELLDADEDGFDDDDWDDFDADEDEDEDDEDEEDEDEEGGGGEGGEQDGEDEGEVAQQAMSDLFVVADKLRRDPWDPDLATDLVELADVIDAARPPFGISQQLWSEIRSLAGAVREDLDAGADDDLVAQHATDLRDVLRRYV
jgi:hypothetical protein